MKRKRVSVRGDSSQQPLPSQEPIDPSQKRELFQRVVTFWNRRHSVVQPLLLVAIIAVLLAAIPVLPFAIGTGMDASWNYALNLIRAKGISFGDHVIFTMGPLGYLATPDPDYTSSSSVLAFRLFAYGLLTWGVVRCARHVSKGSALVVATVLVTQMLLAQHYPDVWQAAYLSVFLAAAAASGRSLADLIVAAFATGFTLLFKLNEGTTAGTVFLCLVAYSYFQQKHRRNIHIAIALVPPIMLLAGMAMQGSWFSVVPYIRYSLELMGGYSQSVSMPGPVWQSGLAISYLILILAMPLLLSEYAVLLTPGAISAAIVGFVQWKHGMVRQDGHADMVQVKIAGAALFLMVVSRHVEHRRVFAALALFGAVFTACIVSESQPWLFQMAAQRSRPSGMLKSAKTVATFGTHYSALRDAIHSNVAPLRLDEKFHQLVGSKTIDVFSENVDVIRANGWNYHPRPNLQSSASYTKVLDEKTAAYLRTPAAADLALFTWYTIDGRHPFLQDPKTFAALLDTYTLTHTNEKAMLLSKRPQPLQQQVNPIASITAAWDQLITVPSVPAGHVAFAKIEIERSLWGALRAFLFRASPVYVNVNYKNASQATYRVVPVSLSGGAILSPLPRNLSEFSMMLRGEAGSAAAEVATISWTCGGCSDYKKAMKISWGQTALETSPLPNVPAVNATEQSTR